MFSCLGWRKRKTKHLDRRFSARLGEEILSGHYVVEKRLGRGATGTVVRARDIRTGEIVAIKKIERGPKITAYVEREVLIHHSLSHNNIIGFKEVFLTSTHLCIVLEYANGGDLVDYMNKYGLFSERMAKDVFGQLIEAVAHCHSKEVVNRDIKLENILLCISPGKLTVKLADFGFSKYAYDSPQTRLGTLGSLPPELLKYASHNKPYDGMKVDIWTCGVVLFRMLYGTLPFEHPLPRTSSWSREPSLSEEDHAREVAMRIKGCHVYYPPQRRVKHKLIDISSSCVELLSGILSKTKHRWSLSQIRESEWLSAVTTTGDDCHEQAPSECWQTEGEIRNTISRAKVLSTEEAIFGYAPPTAQSLPAFQLLVRISEVGSEYSNPTTPEPSSSSMPALFAETPPAPKLDMISQTP